MKPSTTRRRLGTTEITRSTRMIRMARSTESPFAPGSSEMATMTKSKLFQPLKKNRWRCMTSFRNISTVKIARQMMSIRISNGPARCISPLEVCIPRTTALIRITASMKWPKARVLRTVSIFLIMLCPVF